MRIADIVLAVVAFLLGLSVHEMAHAWVADRLGDPTARRLGRVSLNPLVHLDPVGTLLFPGLLIASGAGFVFGWARPVPVNPANLRNPARDGGLISAAGPLSNLLLGIGALFLYALLERMELVGGTGWHGLYVLLSMILYINFILAFFNLIPVPPLDGGGILLPLLRPRFEPLATILERHGFLLLILLVATGGTRFFTRPAIELASWLLAVVAG